jgi:hypothetical protein
MPVASDFENLCIGVWYQWIRNRSCAESSLRINIAR